MARRNLIGQRFGDWLVIEELDPVRYSKSKTLHRRWLCECICGKRAARIQQQLISGQSKGCGCSKKLDLTGQYFGDWEVISEAPSRRDKGNNLRRYWNCLCVCGERKEVIQANLRNGSSQNCGCNRTELSKERILKINKKRYGHLDTDL